MSEHDPRAKRLIEDLLPVPGPPADMAARVLSALQRKPSIANAASAPARVKPAVQMPRIRNYLMVAAASLALAAGALIWWVTRDVAQAGTLVAAAPETVAIGARATAAAEPGADLSWSLEGARAQVRQRSGSVVYRVRHGGPFHVVTPTGEVEVTGTGFRVATTPSGAGQDPSTVVTVLEGSVKVRTDVGQLALVVGQAARLARGHTPALLPAPSTTEQLQGRLAKAEARLEELEKVVEKQQGSDTDREAPVRAEATKPAGLLLPPSSRLRVHSDRTGRLEAVSLALGGGARPGHVEVARDSKFRHAVWQGPTQADFVTVPAPRSGDLYWRQIDEAGIQAGPIAHARFYEDGPPALGASGTHHNEVGDLRDTTTIHFQGTPPALTLAFTARAGVARHRVRVYRADALATPVIEKVVSGTRCEVDAGALAEGHYVWNALPLDERGAPSGGGRMNKLDLVYDNAVESLALSRLSPGEVAGVAPTGARVFVDGHAVDLDDKGRFLHRLAPPRHTLVIRVVTPDGADSYWVKGTRP